MQTQRGAPDSQALTGYLAVCSADVSAARSAAVPRRPGTNTGRHWKGGRRKPSITVQYLLTGQASPGLFAHPTRHTTRDAGQPLRMEKMGNSPPTPQACLARPRTLHFGDAHTRGCRGCLVSFAQRPTHNMTLATLAGQYGRHSRRCTPKGPPSRAPLPVLQSEARGTPKAS